MFDLLKKKISSFVEKVKKPKKERKAKVSIVKKAQAIVSNKIKIEEDELSEVLEDFELDLLEADVGLEAAEMLKEAVKEELVGLEVSPKDLDAKIKSVLYDSISSLAGEGQDIEKLFPESRPIKIVFVGINGAGKTTTIAKIAYLLKSRGYKVVLAAGDTFRAAAMEQLEHHAKKLGIPIIKRPYGSDPTSVAYDAVNYAKARNIDVVLIDTAGRQNTNVGLINEMKKLMRVIEPDIKIYVGEAVSGSLASEQIKEFEEVLDLDGVILTKADCDPKGGVVLSIKESTGLPILYLGVGQNYSDLVLFSGKDLAKAIINDE